MANKGSVLTAGQYLSTDDYLVSDNGQYFAIMQGDGNFVLYRGSGPSNNLGYIWAISHTALPTGPYFAIMQGDGNFVVYKGTGPSHNLGYIWAISHTALPTGPYFAIMQNDGNFVVYKGTGPSNNLGFVWATNTVAGVGEKLNIVSGNNQTQPRFLTVHGVWTANFAPLSVVFTDNIGNPYAGKQITWTAYTPTWSMYVDIPPYGGMNVSYPVPTTTDSHGNVTVNGVSAWTTDGSDGSFTIVAKSDSASATFNLTIGGLSSVVSGTILAGNNQSVARSTNASWDVPVAIFAPLQVKVLNPDGTPASGVQVGFACGTNPQDIVVVLNTVATDGSGIATLSNVTAYDRTGTFTVVASIVGGNQLTFSETVSS